MVHAFFSILILISISVNAQVDGYKTVSGKIVSKEGLPVEFATVILKHAADSAVVKVEISGKQGSFNFEGITAGSYLISVNYIGFVNATFGPYHLSSAEVRKLTGDLIIKPYSKVLDEVDITAKERFVEIKSGKIILNIESSILSSGSTAYDILNRAPGVQIDNSDNIRLNGKSGVLIMIDGKQTFMENENLIDLLKNTQSANIQEVELISNPSAKYAAAGIASIINIRIKKDKNFGTNGVLSAMAGGSDLGEVYDPNFRYSTGLSFNHRNKTLNVFGNYNHADISQSKNILSFRQLANTNRTAIDVDFFSKQQRIGDSYRVGTDFNLGKGQIIGFLMNGTSNRIGIDKLNSSGILNQGSLDSTIFAESNQNRKLTNHIYNLNYKGSLGKKAGNLSVDLDYLSYDRTSLEYLKNNFRTASGSSYRENLDIKNSSPSEYTIQSFKLDYSVPLSESSSLDLGLQASKVKGESQLDFGSLVNSVFLPDARFTNQFSINERINAAFFSLNKDFKNSTLVMGLRVEQTNTKGLSITSSLLNSRNYLDLFPNLQYTQNLNKNNKLLISYSRRIGRPGYDALNPFLAYLDQYSFRSGNPLLRPAYTQVVELGNVYKDKFSATLRASFVDDVFLDLNEQNDQTFVNTIITKNLDKEFTYGLELNAPIEISPWWNADLNLQANMVKYSTGSSMGLFNNTSPDIIITTLQSFSLGKRLQAELSTEYESPTVYGIYNFKASYNVDAGFSASVFQKKGSLKLRFTDIFNISQNQYSSIFENLDLTNLNKNESRSAQLSFSYSFGKKTIKSARRRSTGSEIEQGRVGN